jgi:hypothetical protein
VVGIRSQPGLALLAGLCLLAGAHGARAASNPSVADSLPAPSASLDSLASKMSRNRLTRTLSRYVFQATSQPLQTQALVQPAEEYFTPYRDRFIQDIIVVQLNVLPEEDPRSADAVQSTLEKVGQALHRDTREGTIRKYFLMQSGDQLDPGVLADTERLLRATPFLREAEIVVIPSPTAADSADLIVVTRDTWSLGLDVKVKSISSTDVRVADRNVGGWGHAFQNEFQFDSATSPPVGYVGTYAADDIRRTFIRNFDEFRHTARETSGRFSLARERVVPQIRTTGALDIAYRDLHSNGPAVPGQAFFESHVWLGRARPVGEAPAGGIRRAAVVVAAGLEGLDYSQRPDSVSASYNRAFADRTRVLSSVSFTRSAFSKGRLLRGYGRTDDIPTGVLATLTGGVEWGEFATRAYGGGLLRAAGFSGLGYLDGSVGAGAFFNDRTWEDGIVDLSGHWFSDLAVLRRYGFRQFATVQYTAGFRRQSNEHILLDDEAGLDGLRGAAPSGRSRLVGDLESVLFTPWQAFGFKFTAFGKWSAGSVGPAADSFLRGAYFSTVGVGLRIHNAHLILDPLELHFSFAVHAPAGTSIAAFDIGNLDGARWAGLEPGPPTVTEYK